MKSFKEWKNDRLSEISEIEISFSKDQFIYLIEQWRKLYGLATREIVIILQNDKLIVEGNNSEFKYVEIIH